VVVEEESDGQISCDEFISWYLLTGKYYLKKPSFKSKTVTKPTREERETLFYEIDLDGSGELDLDEVQGAVSHLWPDMNAKHTQRAFETADEDGGGLVSLEEFKKLLGFILWFNEKRHQIEELEENFGADIDGDKFYFACSTLGEPMSDVSARENFERLCSQTGVDVEEGVPFNKFLGWLARRHYVDDDPDPNAEPEEVVELLEDAAEVNEVLGSAAGEYGDVHLQDLASVMGMRSRGCKCSPRSLRAVRSLSRDPPSTHHCAHSLTYSRPSWRFVACVSRLIVFRATCSTSLGYLLARPKPDLPPALLG
jgi:Ca2+-binding EF-hand superfamily protein